METDITATINRYRETVRHLWNDFFHDPRQAATYEQLDAFFDVRRLLFVCAVPLVLPFKAVFRQPIPQLQIVPEWDMRELQVLVQRERSEACGYWDYPIDVVSFPGTELQFIDFFDFDEMRFREFRYVHARIAVSAGTREVEGRDALVECSRIRYLAMNAT